MTTRTDKRIEFLTDILTGAIENYGYGWFVVHEYRWQNTTDPYALVEDESDGERHRIDLAVVRRGLGVIRNAVLRSPDPAQPTLDGAADSVLFNAKTGERLYISPAQRRNIMLSDRTNGDDGDMDVIDYLAVVECGLFGKVVYA